MVIGKGSGVRKGLNGQARTAEGDRSAGDRQRVKPAWDDLTESERQILELIWEGMTNRYIAEHLKVSIRTVETHRTNMMRKFRVTNTAQLLKAGIERGFLEVNPG